MSGLKAPAGQFTLLYFAAASSYTAKQHDFLPAPLNVGDLWDALEARYQGFKSKVLESSALTVNLDYVDIDEESAKGPRGLVIQAGDEVAIIPPSWQAPISPAFVILDDFGVRQPVSLLHLRPDIVKSVHLNMSTPTKSIVYKTAGKIDVSLDVYLPNQAKSVPILLWFHGGGLLQGRRSAISPHHLRGVNKYNYAFITADYRLAPQVGVADILDDVKDCISFIRNDLTKHVEKESVDVSRIAVSGSSAGGYLAFLAGLYVEPKPNVILPIYPITDPLGLFFITSQGLPFGPVDLDEVRPFVDPTSEVMSFSDESSARNKMYFYMLKEANLAKLLHVKLGDDTFRVAKKVHERGLPPTYVVHGDIDRAVGVEQSDEVVGVMAGLGMEVLYERLHDVDHLFDREESVELDKMYAFLKKHL